MRYALIALLILPILAAAGSWCIESVDLGDTAGLYSGKFMALDSSDNPHIVYYDYVNDDLKYAAWDGIEWLIETVDSEGDVGKYASLALDSLEYPHIAYRGDYPECNLKYAYWDGVLWHVENVGIGQDGNYTDLVLDNLGYPHIVHSRYMEMLMYTYWDGSAWQRKNIEYVEIGGCGSIQLDNSGVPHIAYNICRIYDDPPWMCIEYTYWDIDQWHFEMIEDCTMSTVSLALDTSDNPHVAFSAPNNDLRYAFTDGGEWQLEDTDVNGGRGASISLDLNNYPHISHISSIYQRNHKNELFYSYWDGEQWLTDLIDTWFTSIDRHTTLVLDSNYNPYIAYCSNSIFKVAKYLPDELHLLNPLKGGVVDKLTPILDWEDSPFPDHESYTIWWGEDPDFETYNEITDITESGYTIPSGIEDGDRIYWRVKSIDDLGREYWAKEMDWYFDVELGSGVDIVDFGADATDEGVLIDWRCKGGEPAGVRVLRGEGEPEAISGLMPGDSARYLDRGVEPGGSYVYWLEVTEADGSVSRFGPTAAVAVPEETFTLVLYAAYPSPSRDAVNFAYSIPADGRVVLSVYDLSGRRIATPVDAEVTAGRHEVSWSCAEIPSGVYLYRLETCAGSLTQRLVVSR